MMEAVFMAGYLLFCYHFGLFGDIRIVALQVEDALYQPVSGICLQSPTHHTNVKSVSKCAGKCLSTSTCTAFAHGPINEVCLTAADATPCENDPSGLKKYGKQMNECLSRPCTNGGTCQDEEFGYSCSCASGFSGTNCEAVVRSCTAGWIYCPEGGTCVKAISELRQFVEADEYCYITFAARLVEIESQEKHNWITSYITDALGTGAGNFWIGGQLDGSIWKWKSSRNQISYYNWGPNEPNNPASEYCLIAFQNHGHMWADITCNQQAKFICELD